WSVGITAFAGVQAGSTPRRTLDLPGTSERRVWGVAGLELDAAFGPFRLEFAPRWEDRLLDDPDWSRRTRGDDQGLALRTPVARLVGEWRWALIEVGEVERNWGPRGVPGLMLSPLGYHRRGMGFAVGPEMLRFQWRMERLSTEPATGTGEPASRWLTIHRLRWRPSPRWELAAWEAMVTAETEGIDPARLNPFAFYTFGKQFGIEDRRNTSVGVDAAWRAGERLWLETQFLLDDLVIWDADENPYPSRFGFTVQARRDPSPDLGWRAWATGLSGLALNTFRPEEAFTDAGGGLGRLQPDHLAAGIELRLPFGRGTGPVDTAVRGRLGMDTWPVARPGDGWRTEADGPEPAGPGRLGFVPGSGQVDLGLRWRRQGEGRFTDPFPDMPPDAPDLPAFSEVVERETVGVHLGVGWSLGAFVLEGESQLQYRRFPATGRPDEWGTEARVQLVWRVGRWSFEGR
ncbi:MAG TPA: hypothetical protein VK858_13855, partial [Longimicrobiales bacterium]|nr:hypothetical protein [Longimicrobiales bacterium]